MRSLEVGVAAQSRRLVGVGGLAGVMGIALSSPAGPL